MALANQDITIKIKTALDASNAATSLGELKKSIKDLTSLSNQVDGEQFQVLQKAAGEANDKIKDLKENVNNLTGTPVEVLTKSFGSLKSSLLSGDFEQAGNQLKNIKGAISDLGGKALEGLKNIPSAMKDMVTTTEGAANGFKNLGKAVVATGIGLLITGIILLVQNFDTLKNQTGLIGDAFKSISKIIASVTQALKDFTDAIGLTSFAQTAATEKLLENKKKEEAAIISTYDREIAYAQAAGKTTKDIELDKYNYQIDLLKKKMIALGISNEEDLNALKKLIQDRNTLIIKSGADEVKLKKENGDKAFKDQQDLDMANLNAQEDTKNRALKIENEKYQTLLHNDTLNAIERETILKNHETEKAKIIKTYDDKQKIADDKIKKDKEAADKKTIDDQKKLFDTELSQALKFNTEYYKGLEANIKKSNKSESEKTKDLLQLKANESKDLIQIQNDYGQNSNDAQVQFIDAQQAIDKQATQAKLANMQIIAGGLATLGGVFTQNTIAYKAFNIASALIDTYAAASSIFRNAATEDFTGGIAAAISAAAAIASGIARVVAITNVPIPNASTPAVSIPGAPSSSSSPRPSSSYQPVTFRPGQSGNLNPNTFNGLGQRRPSSNPNIPPPIKVVVLEKDITNVQNKVNVIQTRGNLV